MVVADIAVKQRITAHRESQYNHTPFKQQVVQDVNTKQGQTAHQQRQQGAVNGTKHRSGDTDSVPVEFQLHEEPQI